jgi:hypothetical protein
MRRLLESILITAGMFVPACSGQALLDEVNFRNPQLGGLHLLGVSVYSGYSTTAYPQTGFDLNAATGAGNLGADISYGASASLGWQRHRDKTDISVMYTGTYGGMVRYSGLNAYGQSLAIAASRMLTPRWTLNFSAAGQDATLAQFLYQPSTLSIISQVPATFDDLAAALAVGQYSNAQVASMLTGAPVMQAPGRSLLMGNRVLSYTAQATAAYALSSRLNLHFASFAAAGQTRFGGQDGVAASNFVMPRSLGANAGVGISYALSPRTEVGANVDADRTVNHFQAAYLSTASAFLGRKMGMHWFLRVQGGATYSEITQQAFGTPTTRQMVGAGSLGFRTNTHTLVASYNRSATDTFGFAVGTVTTTSGAWNWRRAGSRWSLTASFGEQQTRSTGFTSFSGWQTTAGIFTNLNPHTTVTAQYVYLNSSGTYLGTFNNLAIQSVRLSLGWAPQAAQR